MLTKDKLQKAITNAADSGLSAVSAAAFELIDGLWEPRTWCLSAGYSSGEAVLCATLLCFYFEIYGRPQHVIVPEMYFNNSSTDLIWPGAWYICSATGRLSDRAAWDSIKLLLPE